MQIFQPLPELMKGLTDLPIALLSALFGVLLIRKGSEKKWSSLFFLLCAAAALGASVHCFILPEPYISMIWAVEYILLFASVRRFAALLIGYAENAKQPERAAIFAAEGALYLGAVILRFCGSRFDIYLFVIFAALCFFRVGVCLLKNRPVSKIVRVLIAFLLAALLAQALKTVIPGGVVIGHGMIAAALFVIYRLALTASCVSPAP